MERGSVSSWGRRRHLVGGAAAALLVVSLAACSAKASPSPAASPSASSDAATTSPYPVWTPDQGSATPTATDTSDASPSASPTLPMPTGPLPSVGSAPAGTWTGLKWIAIPGGHSPAVPAADLDGDSNATIEGWSKGYIEFVWNPAKRSLTPWTSTDGLRWKAGTRLDTSAWTAGFKSYDAAYDPTSADWDPADGGTRAAYQYDCTVTVTNFQEDSGALLLSADATCGGAVFHGGGCAGGPPGVDVGDDDWTSANGSTWKPTRQVYGYPSGGSAGFIGLTGYGDVGVSGDSGASAAIWTSQDGQTWTEGAVPVEATLSTSTVGDPVSIAGGFVLPGVVLEKPGHQSLWDGCGGPSLSDQSLYEGALWWSPDGTNWTRDPLTSGTTTSYNGIQMSLARVDDHTVVAIEQISNSTIEWASHDGKTWTRLKGQPIDPTDPGMVMAGSQRGLLYEQPGGSDPAADSSICEFSSNFGVVTLKESGDLPWWDSEQFALGPTGLLVTDDGTRFWLGVPTSN